MVEEVFETGSEKIDDKDVMKAFLAKVKHVRNTSCRMSVYGPGIVNKRKQRNGCRTRHASAE